VRIRWEKEILVHLIKLSASFLEIFLWLIAVENFWRLNERNQRQSVTLLHTDVLWVYRRDIVINSTMRFMLNGWKCTKNRSTIMLLSSVRKHKTRDAVKKTFFIDYPVIQRRRDFMILEPGITMSLPVFFLHRLCKHRMEVCIWWLSWRWIQN